MGNNYLMNSAFFSLHLVEQNVGNMIFVCYFLNIGLGPTKSQCSRHFSEKSIPGTTTPGTASKSECHNFGTFRLELLKLYNKRQICVQTLTFCQNLGFQKPWISRWIFQGFSMGFPPHGSVGDL